MSFLIDNREIYNRTADSMTWNIYKDTPIGKLLNFDTRAVAETTKYVKIKAKDLAVVTQTIRLRGDIDTIAQFDCFRRIYASVLTAALVLYEAAGAERQSGVHGTKEEDMKADGDAIEQNIRILFARCYAVQVLSGDKYVLRGYASSLELFPGVFYGALMFPASTEYGSEEYYSEQPARKHICENLAVYRRVGPYESVA
jgi:hypothetical protein